MKRHKRRKLAPEIAAIGALALLFTFVLPGVAQARTSLNDLQQQILDLQQKFQNLTDQDCPPGQALIGVEQDGTPKCTLNGYGADWLSFDFPIVGTNVKNDCDGGEKFVKQSDFDPDLSVGAQLCSADRYKLFLADDPLGPYFEIADTAGHGQDHCELIGGTLATAIGSTDFTSPLPSAYVRGHPGEAFTFSTPPPSNAYSTPWYECGISIP